MSEEREMMRVRLANLKHKERSLNDNILTLCSLIRANLNTTLRKPADLDVAATAGHMDALVMAYGELQGTIGEIARLEAELNG